MRDTTKKPKIKPMTPTRFEAFTAYIRSNNDSEKRVLRRNSTKTYHEILWM